MLGTHNKLPQRKSPSPTYQQGNVRVSSDCLCRLGRSTMSRDFLAAVSRARIMENCLVGSLWVFRIKKLLLAMMMLPLCGCAVTKFGDDGSREVFGFVRMKLPASAPAGALAGETIEISVVGLLVFSSPAGGGVAVGYSIEQVSALKNDVLVLRAPDCAASMTTRAKECSK